VLLTGGNYAYPQGADRFLVTGQPIQGVNPAPPAKRTPLRPDVPCETQQAPDLRSTPLPPPPGRKVSTSGPGYAERYAKAQDAAVKWMRGTLDREGLNNVLKVDPTPITSASELRGLPGLGKLGHFKVTDDKKGASKSR
jgi:hypothetical protein